MVQLPEVHPRTVQPTERSPLAQNPDAKSRGTRDNAVRLRHVEPTLRRAHHSFLSQCIGWRNNNRIDHPIFYLYGEYVVRFFLPDGVFLPCDHGLDFFTSTYVRIQSTSKSHP